MAGEARNKGRPGVSLRTAAVTAAAYLKSYPFNAGAALLLTAWSFWTVIGGTDPLSIAEGGLAAVFVLMRLSHAAYGKFWFALIGILLAFLMPLRMMTGEALFTETNVDTLFLTDVGEAWDFMINIPADRWIPSALMLAVLLLTSVKMKPLQGDQGRLSRAWALLAVMAAPLIFMTFPLTAVLNAVAVTEAGPSSWHMTGCLLGHKPSQNYVIFLGESLRSDALGLYGNRYETTPYLSSIPTKTLSTFVSRSYATAQAVPQFLSLTDENAKPQIENNVISLAKESGLKTYWVSSQMRNKIINMRLSRIALQADEFRFTERYNDFAVIDEVRSIVRENPGVRRLFVIQTYGSHEKVCDRVKDFGLPIQTGREKELDCYLASALKADEIVRRVSEIFTAAGESWSAVFTSDHATVFYRKKDPKHGELVQTRDTKAKTQYEVPFVQFGSDVSATAVFDAERSAVRFTDYFPTWIGIMTNKTEPGYDIFTAPADKAMVLLEEDLLGEYGVLKDTPSLNELTEIPEK